MKKKNLNYFLFYLLILVLAGSIIFLIGCDGGRNAKTRRTIASLMDSNGTVTTEVNGEKTSYAYKGDTVKVIVSANANYSLKSGSLRYDNTAIDEATMSFIMPDKNIALHAIFVGMFNITINPTTNGIIQTNVDKAQVGQSVSVIITPADGYILKPGSLQYNNIPIDEVSLRFEMPEENVIITAEFVEPLVFSYIGFDDIVISSGLYFEFKFSIKNNTAKDILIYPTDFHYVHSINNNSNEIWIDNSPLSSFTVGKTFIKIPPNSVSTVYFISAIGVNITYIRQNNISSIICKLFYDVNGSLLLCSVDVDTSMHL